MKPADYSLMVLLVCLGCAPPGFVSPEKADLQTDEQTTDLEESANTLRARIDGILKAGLQSRELSSTRHAAWQIMHGVVCYGNALQISTPDRGQIGAVEYVFHGGQINGFEIQPGATVLPTTGRPGVKARLEPGSYVGQGHVDQWIAILAMADIPLTDEILIGDRRFTVEDFARQAQYDVTNNLLDEYSWTLIALTHYFPDEPTWIAAGDLEVSWELLVEQELQQNIDESPCGGTHRMAGIVRALRAKERLGLADSPVWDQAAVLVDQLLRTTEQNRGPDGRLSAFYFEDDGNTFDLSSELASSGHLFEFVALAAERQQLSQPWIIAAAERLCSLLEATAEHDLDCGALYHALNGLKIYRIRRFPTER